MITLLFNYFAQFVPISARRKTWAMTDYSAGNPMVINLLNISNDRAIHDIDTYILSANPDYVSNSVRNADGMILFVEYGEGTFNPESLTPFSMRLAVTVATKIDSSNSDNLSESISLSHTLAILRTLLECMNYDRQSLASCAISELISFPCEIVPVDPSSFFGYGGFTAFFHSKL